MTVTPIDPTEAKASTSQANRLYGQATTALREAHAEEFQALLTKAYADAGIERKVRRTPEQAAAEKVAAAEAKAATKAAEARSKALAAAQALAAQYPDLVAIVPQDENSPF